MHLYNRVPKYSKLCPYIVRYDIYQLFVDIVRYT